MPNYLVHLSVTFHMPCEVEANSKEEAEAIAREEFMETKLTSPKGTSGHWSLPVLEGIKTKVSKV